VQSQQLLEFVGPEACSNLRHVIRGSSVSNAPIRGAVDERTVQHAISETGQHVLPIQVGLWKDVMVVDAVFDDQIPGQLRTVVEVPRTMTEDEADRSSIERAGVVWYPGVSAE